MEYINQASRMSDLRWCKDANESIAAFLGLAPRTAIRIIRILEEKGLLEFREYRRWKRPSDKWKNTITR
jgi:Mn-dependent DtxR family transcriptional regulator